MLSIRKTCFQALIIISALVAVGVSSANNGNKTAAPAVQSQQSNITFSNNTLVDFSATSGEPYIKVDPQDNIFVSVPFGLSTTVSLLWKSADGGRSFIPLGTPITRDAVTAPGGGDTHQDFDAQGWVYYVDLSGACVTAAVSTDGGNTFPPERVNMLACASEETPQGAVDDRQWVAAFGNGIGYVTFRNLAGSGFYLFKTTDGGLTWDKGREIGQVSQSGPLIIDKQKRRVTVGGIEKEAIILYQIFYSGTNLRVFRIMDFSDGSPLKVDNLSIVNPGVSIANVFPVMAADTAGNLYAVWSQTASAIFMSASTNRGESWSAPARVSTLSGTNIMPWIVAGDPGRVAIVWYRTPLAGNPAVPESTWEIFMSQSLNALDQSPAFSLSTVSQNIIHRGQICLNGLNCDLSVPMRDRSFLEFPSVSVDSKGAAVVVYNDNSNQVEGPYVVVSKQTCGPSLYNSVGFINPGAGGVSAAAPASGETIRTASYTAGGTHTIPPKNFDRDETGDARFPDHGPLIGQNIPAMDIRAVWIADDAESVTVTMEMADLTSAAQTSALRQAGGDGLLYLTQMDINDDIFWVAAEFRAGLTRFYTGEVGLIRSGTSKKFITYNPDLVNSLSVQGQITATAPGRITLRVPRELVGNPSNGTRIFATAYAMSERGPLLPAPAGVPNPSSLPLQVDASGAFVYTLGQGPQLDGTVEVSLDDPHFNAPRQAQLVNIATESRWQMQLSSIDLTPGPHTLFARQRINGRDASPTTSVTFSVSETLEQVVNEQVRLETANSRLTNSIASFDLRIRNMSGETIFTPLRAEVAALTSGSGRVMAANSDNGQPGVGALWDYTNAVGGDGLLAASELSAARNLRFNNPNNEPFSVLVNTVGQLPRGSLSAASSAPSSKEVGGGSANSQAASTPSTAVVSRLFRLTYNPLLNIVTVELIQL